MMKFAYVGNDNILHIVKSIDTAVDTQKIMLLPKQILKQTAMDFL